MIGTLLKAAGGANPWLLAGLFLAGGAGGWTVATWKAEAAHASEWKQAASSAEKDTQLSEENRRKDRENWNAAIAEARKDNNLTNEEASKILKRLGGINDAIHGLELQATTLALGSCNFSADFDIVRYAAWIAATGRTGEAVGPAREANRPDATAPRAETADPDEGVNP